MSTMTLNFSPTEVAKAGFQGMMENAAKISERFNSKVSLKSTEKTGDKETTKEAVIQPLEDNKTKTDTVSFNTSGQNAITVGFNKAQNAVISFNSGSLKASNTSNNQGSGKTSGTKIEISTSLFDSKTAQTA